MNLEEELAKEEAWNRGYDYAMCVARNLVGLRVPPEDHPDVYANPYSVPPWAVEDGRFTREALELQDAINEAVLRRRAVGL